MIPSNRFALAALAVALAAIAIVGCSKKSTNPPAGGGLELNSGDIATHCSARQGVSSYAGKQIGVRAAGARFGRGMQLCRRPSGFGCAPRGPSSSNPSSPALERSEGPSSSDRDAAPASRLGGAAPS